MGKSTILVIYVNIKPQDRDIWRDILNQFMRKSSILVINVNIKLQLREVWRVILNQSMRKSGILVINVNIKLHHREVWKNILNQSTKVYKHFHKHYFLLRPTIDINKLLMRLFIPIISPLLCRDGVGGSRNEGVKVSPVSGVTGELGSQAEILIPVILFCHHYKST